MFENFKNLTWSGCGGETRTFIFHCKKNKYIFKATFIDIVIIVDQRPNIDTKEKIKISCDLYGQNQSKIHIKDF